MKILLTGATGFVGQRLALIHSDCRCVVRKGEDYEFEDKFIVDSIDANTNWVQCFYDVNAIVHLAGIAHKIGTSSKDYINVNTEGTLRLASEAAKFGVKRFVFVSSIGVNGVTTQLERFAPDSTFNPHNDYAQSKYEAELGLKKIAEETGLEVVIVRPTLVYGPNAPGNFGMITKLVNKLPVLPFGLANNRRDFIAVQNLADLLVTCATHPDATGHTFLASDGETVSIKEFTNAIADGLDKNVIQLPVPVSLMRLVGKLTGKSAMIEQLYGNLEVDSSNIKEVLGWTPPLTMKHAMATLRDSGVK
ncbi:Male sterility protein [Vibrio sp. B1REV9]|uniref:NAD-dependent epimerase/dehydratase family protein n=1 Tax=Vibrio sp. B1REV9 TaxID=2751179 RepID=UPI001AF6A8D9|nr:NAD-dependent epimerase/dehydratase family protein [Vibrio sp. B1REV9]CAE6880928.1 Male sterility protein [Vibrio sp. B1REV9]CAE6965129.1 Male sterility protein [Vibrio sp. B1REV9]